MKTPTARPPVRTTLAAFVAGVGLGTVLVAPEVPRVVAALPSPASLGPIASVLIVGVLSIVVVLLGIVTIFYGLFLADNA